MIESNWKNWSKQLTFIEVLLTYLCNYWCNMKYNWFISEKKGILFNCTMYKNMYGQKVSKTLGV